MLDRRNKEAGDAPFFGIFTFRQRAFHRAEQSQIVRLRGAAGENHIVGPGVYQCGNLQACFFHQQARGAALGMDGGRIAGHTQCMGHRRKRFGPEGRRGVVIEIMHRSYSAAAISPAMSTAISLPMSLPKSLQGLARPSTRRSTTSASDTDDRKTWIC